VRPRTILVSSLLALAAAATVAVAANGAYATSTLKTRHAKLGTYVVDGKGLSLYLFEKDKGRKSSCYGTCAKVWKPLTVKGKPTAGSGLKRALLSTSTRTDGTKQVTYGGHPLYYYDDDHKAGQTEGQGVKEFGAKWYVVKPSGKKIDSD
jgi:predicted lipoprotein with Yx(FWY)xxD motif